MLNYSKSLRRLTNVWHVACDIVLWRVAVKVRARRWCRRVCVVLRVVCAAVWYIVALLPHILGAPINGLRRVS